MVWMINSSVWVTTQLVVFIDRRFETPCWLHPLDRPRRWSQQGTPKRRPTNTKRWVTMQKLKWIMIVLSFADRIKMQINKWITKQRSGRSNPKLSNSFLRYNSVLIVVIHCKQIPQFNASYVSLVRREKRSLNPERKFWTNLSFKENYICVTF